jgi:hypothetical protein
MPSVIKTIRLPPAALAGGLELRNKLVGTNQQDARCKSIELALADISTSETANVRGKTDAEGCTGASRAFLHNLSCLLAQLQGRSEQQNTACGGTPNVAGSHVLLDEVES